MDVAKMRVPQRRPWRASCVFLLFATFAVPPSTACAENSNNGSTASAAHASPSPLSIPASRTAAEVLAVSDATYVTSTPTTHLLAWWVAFLIAVGALGVLAMCALPIYSFMKGRNRHAEEVARAAEINKSMQEMTARLYRTRQLYEKGFGALPAQPSPPPPPQKAVEAKETERQASVGKATPPLVADSAAQVPEIHDGARGEAAVATSGGQLERGASQCSIASSASSGPQVRRQTSVGALASRTASARSLNPNQSPGQLTRAPSVRAFAGMSRVEALRRALGGPQLHPVPSARSFTHSHSPSLPRQPSTGFVSSGAFPAAAAEVDEEMTVWGNPRGSHESRPRAESDSLSLHSLEDGPDTLQPNDSGTVVACGATLGFAEFTSLFTQLPSPPPPPMATSTDPMKAGLFAQAAVHSTAADNPNASNDDDDHHDPRPNRSYSSSGSSRDDGKKEAVGHVVEKTRRGTIDRVSEEMHRLLKPSVLSAEGATVSTVAAATTTATPSDHENRTAELTDAAAPRLSAAKMEVPHRRFPMAVPLAVARSESDEDSTGTLTRFVLPRSGPGGPGSTYRVEGRPMTVNTLHREAGDEQARELADVPVHRSVKEPAEAAQQHVLSQTSAAQPERRRTAPSSSPTRRRQRRDSLLNRLSQSEEYSRLMDSQFQQDL